MEARIVENQIVLPIGTAISFKMIAKNHQKIDLKVTESEENSKFFALFDENDVDFEIEINNVKCIHGIGYTLIVNNGFYDYYIGAGERWLMEALYTRGRKLHFISQNSEEGQNVIKETAEEYDITYSESAALCSRIEFNFEVEKVEPKPLPQSEERGLDIRSVTRTKGKSFLPSFGCLSSSSTGNAANLSEYSLGQDVPDSLQCRAMSAQSPLFGSAAPVMSLSKKCDKQINRYKSNPQNDESLDDVLNRSSNLASLAQKWIPSDQHKEMDKKTAEPQIGDKGVVCFGEQSNQYYNPYNGFTKDKNLEIKPFVVELRFSKKSE